MKKLIKVLVLTGMLAVLPVAAFSQLSVSYYFSNLSKIGLGYDFGPRFWTELRLYSDTDLSNITPELIFCYNAVTREQHNIYLGLGVNVNYLTGFVLPVGVQFSPFEKLNRFSMHIELEPTLDFSSEDLIIQASAGIRYKFIKNT